MSEIFYGPNLKIDRAKIHIIELDSIFQKFAQTISDDFFADRKNNEATQIGHSLPQHMPTLLGDAIHNLKSSLDHLYCILTECNGNMIGKKTQFPFSKNKDNLAIIINKIKKSSSGPADYILDFIMDEIQPYIGGRGENLYGLNALNIRDKHIDLIPITQLIHFKYAQYKEGGDLTNVTFETNGAYPSKAFIGIPQLNKTANNIFSIQTCFGDVDIFKGKNVIQTLMMLSKNTSDTIRCFKATD